MINAFNKQWFLNIRYQETARASLICFHHGGGSAASFWPWKSIPLDINIWALKLPGRDNRMQEALLTSVPELITKIIDALPSSFHHPIIFYGHSMGAGLAFELILALKRQHTYLPTLFIATGREPPSYHYQHTVNHLTDEVLIAYIKKLGGVAQNFSMPRDFLAPYLLKIRADYALNANIPVRNAFQLPLSIAIVNGKDDPLIRTSTLVHWQQYTAAPLTSHFFDGNHFFMEAIFPIFMHHIANLISPHMMTSSYEF